MWKKAMTYLGLGDDDDYADYELEPEPDARRAPAERRPPREPARPPAAAAPPVDRRPPVRDPRDEPSDVVVRGGGTVRPMAPEVRGVDPRVADPRPASGVGNVTPRSGAGVPGRGAVVRPLPVPVTAKPHVVHPVSFNGAQEVADIFKGNVPVIMNLQEVDRDLSRRLIDFASGLCYGLGGSMDKVATSVYLLTPADVEVSAEEKRRLGFGVEP